MNLFSPKSFEISGQRWTGPVVAVVTSLDDPEKMGRAKVKFPWLDEKMESAWARVVSPYTGKGRGIQFLPEVDDEVLVFFNMGYFQKPIIVGGLWNGQDKPPSDVQSGSNDIKCLKTRENHKIEISDSKKEGYIEITDGEGEHSIKIDLKGDKIVIHSNKEIELSSPQGKINLKAEEINIEATGKLKSIATSETLIRTKNGNTNVKGQVINLN